MLAASHALTGAVIASLTPFPSLGYLLALLSHPLLDFVPHWDFNIRLTHKSKFHILTISLLDASLGIIPGLLLFGSSVPILRLLATMLLAQAPDWFEAPYHLFNWRFPPFSTIKRYQSLWHHKLNLPWGLLTQIIFLGILLLATG